jgi:alkylhydroperoxidase family enzyme
VSEPEPALVPPQGWRTLPQPRVLPVPLRRIPAGGLALAAPLKVANRFKTPGIFATIANNRKVFRAWVRFGMRVAIRSTLGRKPTELVVLRTAWNCGCHYVWTHHQLMGRLRGLDRETIRRVADGPDAPGWSADDAHLLRAVDELHDQHCITDATWTGLATRFDDQQRIQLCFLVGHYEMLAMTLNSLGVQYEHELPG